jgi:Rrf2 family protein
MKFSAQEEYGLRCLLQIARRSAAKSALTIPEISEMEGLSQTHVAKLLMILRKEGFITSTRGQIGGYTLARGPAEISVRDVLTALGGRLFDGEFCSRHAGQLDICRHAVDCGVKSLWQEIQSAVDAVTASLTVADLIPAVTPNVIQLTFSVPRGVEPTSTLLPAETLAP